MYVRAEILSKNKTLGSKKVKYVQRTAKKITLEISGSRKKNYFFPTMPYSLSNCLLAATLEKAYQNCPGIYPQNRYGLMSATGLTLGCLNR